MLVFRIIILTYNRPLSLHRLLNSIQVRVDVLDMDNPLSET